MTDDREADTRAKSETKTTQVTERALFVGRKPELAQFNAIVKRRQPPALVVISAEAGMGKTSLLMEVQTGAVERGWTTAHIDGKGALCVTIDTTEDAFCARVRELLAIPDTSAGQGAAIAEQLSTQSRLRSLHPLVRELHHRAPILLLIDGYRPGAAFTNWFTDRFIRDIKQAKTRVVVVAADRPRDVAILSSSADGIISMGPLDPQAVRQHFELIGQRISPPMKAIELKTYVKAASQKPEILGNLTRVLQLVQTIEQ